MNFEEYFQRIGQAEQSVNDLNQPAGEGIASSLPDYMPGIEAAAEEHAPGWMRPALNAVRPEWEEKRNRWEELGAAALYGDFLKTGRQGELDARVQEVIGKNKVFRDFMEEGDKPLSRMYMGREVMRALYGSRFRDVPEMYFHSRGEQMPENGRKSLNDGYAAVWDDFSGKTRKRYADYQQKKAEFQRGLEEFGRELETALPEAVLHGKTLSPDMMEKATRYGQAERVTASLQRARAAVDLLRGVNRGGVSHGNHEGAVQAETEQILQEENKEATSYRFLGMEFGKPKTEEEAEQQARANLGHSYEVTREFISHLVNVLSDEEGQLDEGALGAMMLALDADAQGQQTIDARFVRNMGEALKRWWTNSDDFLRRYTGKDPFNEFLDVRNALTGGESFTLDEYLNKKQHEEDTHQRLYEDPRVEKLKSALSRLEDTRLSAADKASFLAGSLTELGTITGDSAPAVLAGFASGGLSIAAFAPASMNRSVAQSHAEGRQNAELYGLITGGFDALAEGSFGVAVRRVPFVGKLMDKAALKLVGMPVVGKAAAAVQSNWFLRYLGDRVVAESFGELVGEEVISQTGSYLTIQGLRGLGVNMDAPEWKPFSTAWENIQDERQSAATVAYCAALGLMGLSTDTRAAREFSWSRENLMTVGLTPETATRLATMTEDAMNQAALLQAGGDLNASKLRELDDKLQTEYRNAYQKEVVNEDPVKLRDRLKKNHDLFMSDVEAQVSLKEGVLKAALREQGVLDVEESLTGKNVVTVEDTEQAEKDRASWQDGKMPEGYETPVKKVEWTDDQLAAYSQYAIGNEGLKRMKAIRSAALNLDMAAKVDEKEYAKTLPLTESAVPVATELARSKGAITIDALRAMSEAAAKEGEAGRNVLPGVSNAAVGAMEESFVKRLQWEARSGNTVAASRLLAGEGGAAAIRLTAGEGPASRILYNPGHTLSTNLTEDVVESMLVDKMRKEGGMDNQGALTDAGKEWLATMHRDMQAVRRQVLVATGKDIMPGLEKAEPSLMNVAEYFSHLSQSAFYQQAGEYGLNDAAMRHVKFMDSALIQTKFLNDMGAGFAKWADTEAGRAWQKEGGTLAGLLRETGHELADLYTSSRVTAENVAAVEEARMYRRANGTRTVEDIRAELEAAEQEAPSVTPESELEAQQPQEIPAEESVTGEAIPAEANEEVPDADPESGQFIPPPGSVIETEPEGKGRGLEGGRYAEDGVEGSVIGMVPFSSLEFSKLPQAAHAAADGMAEVLRHADGRMEVIMGGFMLRRRTQGRTVKVRVWDADAIHNEAWVRRRILEQAVLSGADKFFDVRDFLEYYSGLPQEELPKNPFADRKLRALTLLRKGETQLVQDVIDGRLSWQDAYAAVETAATQKGQRFFLDQKATDKKAGLKYLTALTRAYEAAPDADMNILRKQARYVVAARKEIRKAIDNIDIKYSRGWKSVAEEEVLYGISLSTMKEFLDAMKRLRLLDASFDAFESDLDIPGRAAEWNGKAPVFVVMDFFQAREKVKKRRRPAESDLVPATFSLSSEKEAIRQETVADGTFMKAPNGADTDLTEDQWLSVRTEAFKKWFGDWEHDPENASKAVDENGEPKVVYHGSNQWFTSFNDGKQRQQSGAPAGMIFANDNREIAVSFADYYGGHADEVILDPNDERHPRYSWGIYREGGIYNLFMNVRNPLVVDFEGRPWLDSSKGGDINALCSKAKESGHDGVIALNIVDVGINDQENVPASTDYVAFDSVQVKSATQNRGTYDPKNPNTTFSVTALDGDGAVLAPEAFITRPDGNPDWFTIPKRRGQAAMPVRLLAGKDMGEHKGYGLTHIAASRDLDGLWVQITPERYLSSILANASELYEVVPGREILVKGKRPASWMVLQLVKADGYYSIITAHPVEGTKKPKGRKIPFDGRFSSTPGKEATGVFGSKDKNPSGGLPSKGGALDKASQEAMTADRGYAFPLPPGARVVNINDVRLRFDDRRHMPAGSPVSTMSLALMDDGLDTAPHLKERVMQQLIGDVRTAVRRFNRVFAGSTSTESAARELGQAQALLGMINKYANRRYRPRLAAQMRYVEVYARMLESGKILSYGKLSAQELESLKQDLEADLADAVEVSAFGSAWETAAGMEVEGELKNERMLRDQEKMARQEVRDTLVRDYAGRKLDEVVRDMLNQGAAQLEKQLKDEEIARIGSLLDFLRPRKDAKTGKLKKGLMNADAYRRVARITRMMEAPAEKKAEEMERLNHQLAADELAEADHDRISLDLLDWSAYGALESMSLDAVRAAGESLRELVLAERNVWESRLEDEKNRLKKVAMDAAAVLGRADATKILRMKEKEEKAFRKFGVIGRHLMSFSQAMYAMSGMPGIMKELARETLDAVADGHVILTAREKAIMDQLEGFMKDELGLKKKRQRADFIQGLKKTIKTGIVREKVKVHSLDLTVEEAQRWLSMSKDERQAERDRLREEAESKGWGVENMVEENDLLPLKEAVHSALNPAPRIDGKKGRKRERVQVRREFMEKQEPLEASADQLLNVILTYEQPFYAENARINGYTPEVLDALRRKVGADALAYGYKMRDLLSESGVAEEFERREGVPFPAQTNYWMSRFHDASRINQDRDALDMERGTGTRYGMLIQRVDHRHEVDLSLGASNVFLAACAQQNNYLVMGRMTVKWRRLLANKEFAGALNQRLGDGLFASLKQMLDLLDGAGVMEAVTQRAIGSLLGMFQSAHAVSVLSAALTTIAKQLSALMHAAAFKSPARVIKQLMLDRAGAGRISFGEMLRKPFFQARFKDDRVFVELMRMGSSAKWTRMAGLSRVGMQALEHVDVWSNCASMTALYNLTWQDLEKENRAAAVPMTEEQMEEICDRTVKNALELVGQPQRLTQRSMMAALGKNNLWVRMNCYMGGEMLNKVGMTAAIGEKSRAEGDGVIKRFGKKMLWLSTMSGVEQIILMLLDLMRGNGPDDDELPEWLVYNAITGLSGLGLLNTLPILGPTLEEVSGQLNKLITGNGKGFIKTGLLDDMLFNLGGWSRCVKKFMNADKMSGEEMALAIADTIRLGAAGTGLGRGVNSTMQWTSTLSGILQSCSAVGNMVRPFIQRAINEEKKEKKERKERARRW